MQALIITQSVICICCPMEQSFMCCFGLQENMCRN